MTIAVQYCPKCGGGNLLSNEECFACHHRLTPIQEQGTSKQTEETLLRGRYRLLNILGMGGFGMVYRAIDTRSQNRVVAIKQTNISSLNVQQTMDATDTFNREVKLLSTINHPQLPRIYNHFSDPEHWYLVMNLIEGDTFESIIHKKTQHLSIDDIFSLGIQLCDILYYLHSHKPPIIYRDLKPGNIMRNSNGVIFLIDFGTARFVRTGQAQDTIPLGSPGYASPEQYGKTQTSPQSDIYSLGAVLHQLFTGDDPALKPFAFKPIQRPDLPIQKDLQLLINSMLDPEPVKRPKDMLEVKERLQQLRNLLNRTSGALLNNPNQSAFAPAPAQSWITQPSSSENASRPANIVATPTQLVAPHETLPKVKRRKFLLATGGVLTLAALGGGIWEVFSQLHQSSSSNNNLPALQSTTRTIQTAATTLPVVSIIANSFDNNHVAVLGIDAIQQHIFQVWNISTGATIINTIVTNPPISIQWAPDNQKLAAINTDGTLNIWNTTNANILSIVLPQANASIPPSKIQAARWSADQSLLAVLDDQGAVTIWNTQTGTNLDLALPFGNKNTYASAIQAIAWAPDSHNLAVTTSTNKLEILNIDEHGAVIATAIPQTPSASSTSSSQVTNLSWSKAQYIVTSDQQQLAVHQVNGNTINWKYAVSTPTPLSFNAISWSMDGKYFACLDSQNTIVIYNTETGNQLNPLSDQSGSIGGLSWSSSNMALLWITCPSNQNQINIQTWQIPV